MKKQVLTLLATAMLSTMGVNAWAGVTGNIGVVSSYILRGVTDAPESSSPAVQGGLDWSDESGLYAGYWFSTLGYNYKNLDPKIMDGTKPANVRSSSFENDLYGGFNGKAGDLGYTIGGTVYYYAPGYESTGYETNLGVSYKNVTLNAKTLLNDVTYGNKGDTYWIATLTQPLAQEFTFKGELGAYTYGKTEKFAGPTTESTAFRHLSLGVTHPIAKNGTMGLQYIVGGKTRTGYDNEDTVVASLGFTF